MRDVRLGDACPPPSQPKDSWMLGTVDLPAGVVRCAGNIPAFVQDGCASSTRKNVSSRDHTGSRENAGSQQARSICRDWADKLIEIIGPRDGRRLSSCTANAASVVADVPVL